ncbi:MAG: hypothetical protein U0350_06965 [Caldilineaceae bacterium]
MKRFIFIICLVFVAVAGWRIADRLSSDAVGMAVGVLFGIMAGIPAALMVLAADRRRTEREEPVRGQGQNRFLPNGYGAYPQQPPVIVLAGHAAPSPLPAQHGYPGYDQPARYALPAPHPQEERKFKVVGEKEEWIEEW